MSVERDYDPNTPVTENVSEPLFFSDINKSISSENTILQGGTLRTSNFAGRTATVKPGENINAAIGTLKSAGGGILFLQAGTYNLTESIVGASKISIVGEGRDQTILDFGTNPVGIRYMGTAGAEILNFSISNLTIQNSTVEAIRLDYAKYFRIENIRVTSNDDDGIFIERSEHGFVHNVLCDGNDGDGFDFSGDSAASVLRITLLSCTATNNTGNGFHIRVTNSHRLSFISCVANENTLDGFSQTSATNTRVVFINCEASDNGVEGFDIDGNFNRLLSCYATGNGGDGIDITGKNNTVIASEIGDTVSIGDTPNTIWHDPHHDLSTARRVLSLFNNTGATSVVGHVVIIDPANPAGGFTTTTTVGDDLVVGVVLEATLNFTDTRILIEGKTTSLKVNGTTDIAVGDFLCTYSEAGIAAKAGAGDMAFAIALEAYTTNDSNGVIDALLITPRKL